MMSSVFHVSQLTTQSSFHGTESFLSGLGTSSSHLISNCSRQTAINTDTVRVSAAVHPNRGAPFGLSAIASTHGLGCADRQVMSGHQHHAGEGGGEEAEDSHTHTVIVHIATILGVYRRMHAHANLNMVNYRENGRENLMQPSNQFQIPCSDERPILQSTSHWSTRNWTSNVGDSGAPSSPTLYRASIGPSAGGEHVSGKGKVGLGLLPRYPKSTLWK